MAENQSLVARRRRAVLARHDLAVGAAHPKRKGANEDRPVGQSRLGNIVEPCRIRYARQDGDRAHGSPCPAAGLRAGATDYAGTGKKFPPTVLVARRVLADRSTRSNMKCSASGGSSSVEIAMDAIGRTLWAIIEGYIPCDDWPEAQENAR